MPVLLFILNYWRIFAVGGVMLAAVLWYNKQLGDSFDMGFRQAEAIITARNLKSGEQSRETVQEQSKELVEEIGKQKETIRIVTKEVIKYVENLPTPQPPTPLCRNITLDADFVRLWNDAASGSSNKGTGVSGAAVKPVP